MYGSSGVKRFVSRWWREQMPVRAYRPLCRCAGACHCGRLRPYLMRLETECEFYRDVM